MASQCMRINSKPQNQGLCAGCASPFRQCTSCLKQHIEDELSYVRDPASGLCAFHTAHGAAALRMPVRKMPDITSEPVVSTKKQEKKSQPPEPKIVRVKKNPSERKIILDDYVSEDELARIAALMHTEFPRLTPRQKSVIQLYVLGKDTNEVCKELGISPTMLSYVNSHLMTVLDLPLFYGRSSKECGELRRQVIRRAYTIYETTRTE